MEYVFKNENEVVQRAQAILAGRAYVPPDAKRLMDDSGKLDALKEYIAVDMAGYATERSHAYYFEPSGKLIKRALIGKGDEGQTPANPREVCREGLLCNASYVVMAHNHPNGDRKPSEDDAETAVQTAKALQTVGLQMLLDFIVTGPKASDVVPVPPPKSYRKPTIESILESLR